MKKIILPFLLLILMGCSSNENWQDLFNGQDLSGWHVYGGSENLNGWTVQDGVLVYDPAQRTSPENANLVTNRPYENFELSIEWMISENGNSGLFWGVLESFDFEHPYETGPEIQILDDNWTEYIAERGDIQRAGSIFNIMAPKEIVSKPSGEWNHFLLHINHFENKGWLSFNEEKVLEFPVNGPEWQALIDESGFADWGGFGETQSGLIGLQDHGSKVAFRNIQIREL